MRLSKGKNLDSYRGGSGLYLSSRLGRTGSVWRPKPPPPGYNPVASSYTLQWYIESRSLLLPLPNIASWPVLKGKAT